MPTGRPVPGGGTRGASRRAPNRAGAGPTNRPGRATTGRARPSPGTADAAARPRFTGRAAVLVLVLAVLTVSWASSMKAYLEQRRQITGLERNISAARADIGRLRTDRARWADPAFIKTMAHARLGFVMPGEVTYRVLGAHDRPLGAHDSLGGSVGGVTRAPQWWQAAWASDVAAGRDPSIRPHTPTPATEIRVPAHP